MICQFSRQYLSASYTALTGMSRSFAICSGEYRDPYRSCQRVDARISVLRINNSFFCQSAFRGTDISLWWSYFLPLLQHLHPSLCTIDVLLLRATANTNTANDFSVEHDRQTTTNNRRPR